MMMVETFFIAQMSAKASLPCEPSQTILCKAASFLLLLTQSYSILSFLLLLPNDIIYQMKNRCYEERVVY